MLYIPPSVVREGTDMENAISMARDAIELKCISMEDAGEAIPMPSAMGKINKADGAFFEDGETIVSLVDIDSAEYRRKIDTRTVRKNVSLPSWLNYEAEKAGVNVSRILQDALMQALNVKQAHV